tara:strand:- start:317 stop:976 length:660 start_codon:yes stop_codon:yes gene_type:complete
MISATRLREEASRVLEAALRSEKIAASQVELKDMLENYMEILSIEEIRDVLLELEESVNEQDDNHDENQEEFKDVQEFNSNTNNTLATDTSEDEDIEVSDEEGVIYQEICDEITFSLDGEEATIELIQRLNSDENLLVTSKHDNSQYTIKKFSKKLIIINNNDKPKNEFGIIITSSLTNNSDVVKSWSKYGAPQSKKKKFNFKGENVEEVVQMIHNILD